MAWPRCSIHDSPLGSNGGCYECTKERVMDADVLRMGYASDEQREQTVDVLRTLLSQAERGEVRHLLVVYRRAARHDRGYEFMHTAFPTVAEAVGALDMVKLEMVQGVLAGRIGTEDPDD